MPMHMPWNKSVSPSRTQQGLPLKSLFLLNGLHPLGNSLDGLGHWLLQAHNQDIFSERYMNLHLKIDWVIENHGTLWELGNYILYCTDWFLKQFSRAHFAMKVMGKWEWKTTKETFLIIKGVYELMIFNADTIVGLEERGYRGHTSQRWLHWTEGWLAMGKWGREKSLQGLLDLEIGADRISKQEKFSSTGRDPFLYSAVCLPKLLMLKC